MNCRQVAKLGLVVPASLVAIALTTAGAGGPGHPVSSYHSHSLPDGVPTTHPAASGPTYRVSPTPDCPTSTPAPTSRVPTSKPVYTSPAVTPVAVVTTPAPASEGIAPPLAISSVTPGPGELALTGPSAVEETAGIGGGLLGGGLALLGTVWLLGRRRRS